LQEARLNREFTEVRAPIDGHVSRAIITAGNLVTSASLLTTLVSDDPVYVYFDADEQTYLRYAKAQRDRAWKWGWLRVYIGLVDEDGYPHAGELDFIDNQVDPPPPAPSVRAPHSQTPMAAIRRVCSRACASWAVRITTAC
jgi:multidrug efflux system membrane fusion protein